MFGRVGFKGVNLLTYFWDGSTTIIIEQDPHGNFVKETVIHAGK